VRWVLNDLAGPPSAGGITKGQGAVGLARVGDEAPLPRVLGGFFAVLFSKKSAKRNFEDTLFLGLQKNSRLMIFSLQVTFVVSRAIQAISLRFISGLLPKPNANTTALTCYAKISCAE
jgi:hypothetical protein